MLEFARQIKKTSYNLPFAHQMSLKRNKEIHVSLKCTVLHAAEKDLGFLMILNPCSALCTVDVHVLVCMCASLGHRQTHGNLRSNEYYRGVDHRGTSPITNRQAPHINLLSIDACVFLSACLFSSSFTLPFILVQLILISI